MPILNPDTNIGSKNKVGLHESMRLPSKEVKDAIELIMAKDRCGESPMALPSEKVKLVLKGYGITIN